MLIHEALEMIADKEIESWSMKLENGEVKHYFIKLLAEDKLIELLVRKRDLSELRMPGELSIYTKLDRLQSIFEKLLDNKFKVVDKY